ncbi:MAG: TlpA family protein disulfide reductase [Planctomycetes bacterium]|nr:TlpA family protein disulfide reductase [Planctomycetota bacterium]
MSRGEFFGFALLAIVVGLLVVSSRSGNGRAELVSKGMPLPPLMVEGWLNVEGGKLTRESLNGKVVVIDCWATWCPPCRAAMPELAKLYAKYQPLGVEFLGLTSETERDRAAIENFIASVDGFDWPVGYGALPMQDQLGIQVLPTVIVFDQEGSVVWSGSQLFGFEAAIEQALAKAEG